MYHDIHGQCVSGYTRPLMIRSGCNFNIEIQTRRGVTQDANTLYFINFVIKNVTATCQYMCVIGQFRVIKTVVVTGTYAFVCNYVYACIMYI